MPKVNLSGVADLLVAEAQEELRKRIERWRKDIDELSSLCGHAGLILEPRDDVRQVVETTTLEKDYVKLRSQQDLVTWSRKMAWAAAEVGLRRAAFKRQEDVTVAKGALLAAEDNLQQIGRSAAQVESSAAHEADRIRRKSVSVLPEGAWGFAIGMTVVWVIGGIVCAILGVAAENRIIGGTKSLYNMWGYRLAFGGPFLLPLVYLGIYFFELIAKVGNIAQASQISNTGRAQASVERAKMPIAQGQVREAENTLGIAEKRLNHVAVDLEYVRSKLAKLKIERVPDATDVGLDYSVERENPVPGWALTFKKLQGFDWVPEQSQQEAEDRTDSNEPPVQTYTVSATVRTPARQRQRALRDLKAGLAFTWMFASFVAITGVMTGASVALGLIGLLLGCAGSIYGVSVFVKRTSSISDE